MGRPLGAGHRAHADPGQAGGSASGLQPADDSGAESHIECYDPCDQVETEDGAGVEAVTYVMVRPLVEDRRPSQLYHSVILEGAREHGLPSHYMEPLSSIEHNGDTRGDGSVNITTGRF